MSKELDAARKRGIERLDVSSHNQQPVKVPELEKLAAQYAARQGPVRGRIPQLKLLLRDAVNAFAAEDEMDAQLVSALFFGDSLNKVTKSAGELLDIAQRKFGYSNPVRFRHIRRAAFERFAEFLPLFVDGGPPVVPVAADVLPSARPGPDHGAAPPLRDSVDVAPAPEVEQHIATTGYIDDGDHFVTLLSQAENVTIVGYTNESLASMLRLALARKREAMFRPDGCWSSIRVVFLTDDLLDRVNDERVYPDPDEARVLRRRHAVYGRRTVRIFLRSLPYRASWEIYDSPHFPPFTGTLFEMPDGQRIVQLIVRRPQRSGANHLYLQLEDTRGHYFSSVFDEIVASAVNDNKLVPVGRLADEDRRFQAVSTRYRRNVLIDDSGVRDWLPMVLVITWRMRDGAAEPLLQLRTERNSNRERQRFTHLAGHITQDEVAGGLEFGAEDRLPVDTAVQRVQMETGESEPAELLPLCTGKYLHPDKEHLFFFVYACRLPDGVPVWKQAEMFALSIPELMAIRENQVLVNALHLCRQPPARPAARGAAFEIIAHNLVVHGYPQLAARLLAAGTDREADLAAAAAELSVLAEQTRQTWPSQDGETEVAGLSGFQFRHFFQILLPFYERVGVPEASRQLKIVRADPAKWAAIQRLSKLYADERLMESIPVEL